MKQFFTLLGMLLCVTVINAQLTVDPSFNPTDHGGGKHSGVFGGESDVEHALILSNGEILVGGFYGVMHNKTNQCLSLLKANGSIDPSFHAPGINDDLGDGITAMALQPDGKIILGGYITVYHGKNVYHLVRINANGDLDTSFQTDMGFKQDDYNAPFSIAIQPDGKIIIGGQFDSYNNIPVTGLIRLNKNGSLDNSFNFLSDSTTAIYKVSIEADGKIIIGGVFKIHTDTSYKNLIRLNPDGSLDASFKVDNEITLNTVTALALQTDHKVVFACDSSVYRINTNGSVDAAFVKGKASDVFVTYYNRKIFDIKIQPNGKILVAGKIITYNNTSQRNIVRLTADGNIDDSFSTSTQFGTTDYGIYGFDLNVGSIALFNDGRIFIAGDFLFYRGVWQGTMAELNSDGSLNNTFNADNGNGADANVNKILVQPDNKILIAGYFDAYNGVHRNRIARLTADGILDNNFNTGTGPDSCNIINTVVLQKDGKILAGGNFAHFNNASRSFILRLNNDGSIDNSFAFNAFTRTYGTITDGIQVIALQNDGKIVIGLDAINNKITHTYNSPSEVLRLNADGSIDNSFTTLLLNYNYYTTIQSIKIQSDGRIIIAGNFSINVNSATYKNILRLNTDGSVDETFNAGGGGTNSTVYSVNIQLDNKIIISGDFDTYNSSNANILARLNMDGSIDASYSAQIPDAVTDLNYLIHPVSIIDSNDKVILTYLYYADTTYGRVLRYNINGTIDSTFGTNNKTDYLVSDMTLQNEKLLLGGFIESFNGVKRNHITRITTPEILPLNLLSFTAQKQNNQSLLQWQTTDEINNNYFDVERSSNIKTFSSIGTKQGLNNDGINNYSFVDNTPLKGINYYRLKQVDKDGKYSYSDIASVEFLNDNSVFAIAPNPANDFIKVIIPASNNVSEIIIYDVSGKKIFHEQIAANITSKQININTLTQGVYNVVLIQNGKREVIKLVKK